MCIRDSFWTRLIAVTFVTTGRLLHADGPSTFSDGSKIVPVNVGGRTVPILVKEGGDPFKNVSSSDSTGKYDPERIFSSTSSMAHKSFSLPSDSLSKSNADFKDRDQNTCLLYTSSSPGGRNWTTMPINANEAEGRRLSRFRAFGHTPGPMFVPPLPPARADFPLTLDLRRG